MESLGRAFLILISTCIPLQAHEWYPWECCSDRDCHPMPPGRSVVEEHGGYRLYDGRFVPYSKAKSSPDGKYHVCEDNTGRIICFFAPIGGY
jgi:hypothetical protein